MMEPVAQQWAVFENGLQKTSWTPAGYGDEAGWAEVAKKYDFFTVAYRPLVPQSALSDAEARIAELQRERYELAYAITGGEDAPGLLDSVPVEHLVEIARGNHRSMSAEIDRSAAAEARAEAAEAQKDRDYWKVEAEGERAKVAYRDKQLERYRLTNTEENNLNILAHEIDAVSRALKEKP